MASNPQELQQDANPIQLPPASEPFPGARTPGWNDPPTLQYNPHATPASAARTRLNKRIAFPLQGTTGGDANASGAAPKPTAIVQPHQVNVAPPAMTLPPAVAAVTGFTQPIAVVHPMPNMNVPPSVARVPASTRTVGPVIALPTDAQEISLRILRDQLNMVRETPNVRQEEIERRLELVERLWQAGSLSIPVQEKIYRLAKGISEDNFTEAMDIYRSLVTNHSNECTSWALSVRHIVLTIQPSSSSYVESTPTTFTTESNNIAAIPAMPRQTIANQIDHGAAGRSSVQHI